MNKWFNNFADKVSIVMGRSYSFVISLVAIIVWGITGPLFGFSDTWQLVINTATTIATFLMVFLIQNSQNKSDSSTQIKLDLIMRVLDVNEKYVENIENLTDKELEQLLEDIRTKHKSAK